MIRSFRLCVLLLATACASQGGTRDPVRPGIEVLLSDSIHLVRGRRVGILTNQTGVDRTGKSDVDLLRESGINLTAIFSPEHGFRGNLDRENIRDTVDSATGVPIFSLYGTVRTPTPEMLARVDVLLLDLQDIGGRPYTYISTILEVMKAAREAGRPVIVLDRPNPIGGELVQGPMLDSAFSSFVGMLPVPLRHGLTIGELARFGNARQGIDADLVVIPAAGWRRSQWFDETGLPWVRPSPNMPNLESATHYPGLVLFERTNLSVGRGTPIAFQVIAAPWLDARRVREALPATPGAAVRDTSVTPVEPSDGKYPGRSLTALRFSVTDRSRYDPTRLAVEVLGAIRKVHPDSLAFEAKGFDERAGTDRLRRAIEGGVPAESTWAAWQPGIETFQRERKAFLIYR